MSSPVWSVPRRVAFRFGVVAGILYLFPFPLGVLIPKTEWLAELLSKPWDWLVPWFAETIGLETPQKVMTGSGDTLWTWVVTLLVVILAAIGAVVWSVIDRKRLAYPRLQAAAIVALRYFLAAMMLSYGVAKLVEGGQFSTPWLGRYDQTYGDSSPMGLLWTFMGHSQPYSMFGGIAETVGGLLLLWRRTSVIGALACAAVMTNVVMLNFCYDVPVKLFSSQLLLCAVLIGLPHAHRVSKALLGHAVGEVAPRVRSSTRVERARLAAKLAFLACLAYAAYQQSAMIKQMQQPPTALDGIWVVETFHADSVEHPPLTTDAVRWRKLVVSARATAIRTMTDERRRYFGAKVDPVARTLTLPDPATEKATVLRYQRIDDTLMIEGAFDGKQLRITLVKEPPPLLATRGFHWVQEYPFNR
jgi:uncharacterized membrane protein YphA (DoxX/SURF4 family)